MEKYFLVDYDADLALALYEDYIYGNEEVLDELIAQLLPLVRIVQRKYFASSGTTSGSIEADALHELHRIVVGGGIPHDHPKVFSKFIVTCLKRAMLRSLETYSPEIFDYEEAGSYPYTDSFINPHEIESKIHYEQIKVEICDTLKKDIRFVGRDREACYYIIDAFLGYSDLREGVLRSKCKLSSRRLKYLQQVIGVRLRNELHTRHIDEDKSGFIAPVWTAGRGFLRTSGKLREVYLSS